MQLRLERMGRSGVCGPLVDSSIFEGKWNIGESKKVQMQTGYRLLAKYPNMFREIKYEARSTSYERKPRVDYVDKIKTTEGLK
jgi:hypothetical protein